MNQLPCDNTPQRKTKPHLNSKWNYIVNNWPGHVCFDSYAEASGLMKSLERHGYKPEQGKLKDGRIKVWRVSNG